MEITLGNDVATKSTNGNSRFGRFGGGFERGERGTAAAALCSSWGNSGSGPSVPNLGACGFVRARRVAPLTPALH